MTRVHPQSRKLSIRAKSAVNLKATYKNKKMEEDNRDLAAGVPPLAAAAARGSEQEPMAPLLQQLMDIVGPIYRQIRRRKKGDDVSANGNLDDDQEGELMIRLGHLLEASTGDIHLAAALFLDDYVASTALTESIKTSSSHPLPLKLPKDESNHAGTKKYDSDKTAGTDDDGEKVRDYKKGYSDEEEEEEEEEWSHPSRHSREDGRNVNDMQVSNRRFRTRGLELPNALQDPVERSIQNGLPGLPPPAPGPQGGDDAEGNEEVQIRPQENLNNHPRGVRVSVSDDEITFDSIDLSSFRRKWLGKIRTGSSKHEKTDGPHANHASHTLKTFKRKSSASSSDFYPDEKKQKQHDASSGNKTMHRSQGSSSSLDNEEDEDDSFYSCDSTHRFGKGHEDSNKETDFADDDDNYTDKAVYNGGNNDTKRAVLGDPDTYDNWCKYEDLFERNHDLEPSLLLWGPPSQGKDPEADPAVVEDIQVPGRQQGQGRPAVEPAMNNNYNNPAANVNPVENNDPNIASAQEEKKWPIIPWTWSGCGFQLSPCGTGLILPQPDTDTLQKLNKVHAAHRRLVSSLLPGKVPPVPVAYCGGVTALVSLVTALLYSGVSIVGHEVNCNRDRKSFANLSLEERKLEFPRRLADALSAILFIAAKQSSEKRKSSIALLESELNKERKERSKEATNGIATSDLDPDDSLDPSRDDCESMIKQDLHRQCRLVPVCRWEVEENKMKKPPRLTISLSNIDDLRLYVLSNISQYMSPGGCTLLLESLVHIYGRSRLARTLKKQRRRKSGKKSYIRSLISCNCVEGQFHDWQQQELIIKEKPIISKSHDSSKSIQPQGHKCLSIELLSIILTGQVNTDISSWLTKFGIGLLCAETVEGAALNQAMKYPSNPIWLVRGISSYSVLWHKESTTKGTDLLQPFPLVHWSTWYTGRNKSTLKVIPSYCNTVVNPRDEDERYCPDVECTVNSHPDDETLHPGKFQRWRFNLEPIHKEYLENGNDAKEDTCAIWIPYYRLSKTQKGIVDRKMSPHITLAIWSRWNSARVDEIHHDN